MGSVIGFEVCGAPWYKMHGKRDLKNGLAGMLTTSSLRNVAGIILFFSANSMAFAQRDGPTSNFIRYDRQQSRSGRSQIDFYEDPNGFEREVWISKGGSGTVRTRCCTRGVRAQARPAQTQVS